MPRAKSTEITMTEELASSALHWMLQRKPLGTIVDALTLPDCVSSRTDEAYVFPCGLCLSQSFALGKVMLQRAWNLFRESHVTHHREHAKRDGPWEINCKHGSPIFVFLEVECVGCRRKEDHEN